MDGRGSTCFDNVCKVLGVGFNLNRSGERTLTIQNTQQRLQDMVDPDIFDGRLFVEAGRIGAK